jgi:hypothetical protein
MTSTIITTITTLYIIVGSYCHPQHGGQDPTTAPTNLTVTWNQ